MKSFILTAAFCSLFIADENNAMLGVKINDSEAALKTIRLPLVTKEEGMAKYRTENGNDFSVTCESGKIVYMENDWQHSSKGEKSLLPGFKFGKTTLKEIRKAFGTNGFTYTQQGTFTTETDIVEFNCFELDSKNNEVLVVVTKSPLKVSVNANDPAIADNLKLEAMIIADGKYLDEMWGKDKAFDPRYKKIKLSTVM